jgi:hypothetical protein
MWDTTETSFSRIKLKTISSMKAFQTFCHGVIVRSVVAIDGIDLTTWIRKRPICKVIDSAALPFLANHIFSLCHKLHVPYSPQNVHQ